MIEIPIVLLIAGLAVIGMSTGIMINSSRVKRASEDKYRKLVNQKVYKPQLVSDRKHGLSSLYLEAGAWIWRCQCDVTGRSRTAFGETASEANALKQWQAHVKTHEKYFVPVGEHSHAACDKRFVGLWSLFEKYRTACYCQSTSNELILLNQDAKAFEKELPSTGEDSHESVHSQRDTTGWV